MKAIPIVIFFMVLAALIPIYGLCQSSGQSPTISLEDIYNDFIFQDVVVEGVIQKIVRDTVDSRELGYTFAPPNKRIMIAIAHLKFEVDKVLMGEVDSDVIGIDASFSNVHGRHQYPYELKEGQRWIFALVYWNKGSYNKKYDVKYTIRKCETRFFIQGNEWIRGCWGAMSLREDEFTRGRLEDLYKAFDELRARRSVDALTREADLIVRGKIENISAASGDMTYGAEYVKFKVKKIYKGELTNDEVRISMIWKAIYKPFFRKISINIKIGQEWIVFLKWADEAGYYPFAGVNGMFKVVEDKLIRRGIDDFILRRLPESLEREIKLELSKTK